MRAAETVRRQNVRVARRQDPRQRESERNILPMEDLIGNVTDATFDQYLNAPASVVVYGIANCEGCAYMDGVLAEVAPEFQTKVRFGKGKMHVPGAAREIKKRFSFETYPTIHFYSKGQLVESREGKIDPASFRATIQSILLKH